MDCSVLLKLSQEVDSIARSSHLKCFEAPKSASFIFPQPSESMFPPLMQINLVIIVKIGVLTLMSLWITLRSWRYSNPEIIYLTNFFIIFSSNFPYYFSMLATEPPFNISKIIYKLIKFKSFTRHEFHVYIKFIGLFLAPEILYNMLMFQIFQ